MTAGGFGGGGLAGAGFGATNPPTFGSPWSAVLVFLGPPSEPESSSPQRELGLAYLAPVGLAAGIGFFDVAFVAGILAPKPPSSSSSSSSSPPKRFVAFFLGGPPLASDGRGLDCFGGPLKPPSESSSSSSANSVLFGCWGGGFAAVGFLAAEGLLPGSAGGGGIALAGGAFGGASSSSSSPNIMATVFFFAGGLAFGLN